jgi:putative acetyltransferase
VGAITIARESPRKDDVRRLIDALDVFQASLYPAESNHFLDIEALCAPEIRFFVARHDGQAVACGALRIVGDYGEIKRMFVVPEARGRNLGKRMLECLEAQALAEGLAVLRLETGIHHPVAIGLYRAAGFAECPPFGGYAPDPLSLFMEKRL